MRLEQQNELGKRLLLQIIALAPGQLRPIFSLELRRETEVGSVEVVQRFEPGDPPGIDVRVGEARGLRAANHAGAAPPPEVEPILLPTEDGPAKVHPIATMTAADVAEYMARHDLPEHPLRARRYLSIGCAPCTRPVAEGEDERAGRWAWAAKTECGLHTTLQPAKGT